MASACVNNIGMSPESFIDCPPSKFSSYGWLSPRISFSRDFPDNEVPKAGGGKATSQSKAAAEETDPESFSNDIGDFEFCLEDPVNMLPADELFSDGKLVPLQLSMTRPEITQSEVRSSDTPKLRRRNDISVSDPYLFSPKAPRCSSRWKELLGLKKLYQNSKNENNQNHNCKTMSSSAPKSFRNFLHRSSKSSCSSVDGLNLPLLKDDNDSSISLSSSRLSLSSSSSGHEHDDLPRLSLDSDKPSLSRVSLYHQRARVVKPRSSENTSGGVRVGRSPMQRQQSAQPEVAATVRGASVDSPRMNSSGKIVFHSLERSSSSPSSFNGGPKHHHHNRHNRAMERSYSANVVRVTPVLNVPVCSSLRSSSKSAGVFGLPLFSSSNNKGAHHHHRSTVKQ